MEFRLYCELKVNDRKSGKLLAVSTGVYYVDEEDIQFVLRTPIDEIPHAIAGIREALEDWLKEDLPESLRGGEVIYDFDIIYLDDEAFDDEEDDGE